jgi:putative transposase
MNEKFKRTIVDGQKYVHFVTFSCYRRRRLLDLDHPKKILLGVLNHQLEQMNAKCAGFVVMPDHVHALIWLPESGQLSRFIHGWKRMSSFNTRKWYEETESRYFDKLDMRMRFWQPKYYSFSIYADKSLKKSSTIFISIPSEPDSPSVRLIVRGVRPGGTTHVGPSACLLSG